MKAQHVKTTVVLSGSGEKQQRSGNIRWEEPEVWDLRAVSSVFSSENCRK